MKSYHVKSDDGYSNVSLQHVVDQAAAAGGGIVEIPSGTYLMHDALHLRSGVRVRGEAGAILKKAPSVSSPMEFYIGYGHYEIPVKDPHLFSVGMGILIRDDAATGFYQTTASITAIRGNSLYIDRFLNHDYHVRNNAVVSSVHPLIDAIDVSHAAVEGVELDGNQTEVEYINGCRGGAVFLLMSDNIRCTNLHIHDFNGDGISFQQNTNILIEDCHLHHQTGGGIHPGSGTVRYVMRNNRIHDNGDNGIFYCLRTTHSLCEGNTIRENGACGISIGERDTDHVVKRNDLRSNGGAGIDFRPPDRIGGDRVWLEENHLAGNCGGTGSAEIEIRAGVNQVVMKANQISPSEGKHAIRVESGCRDIYAAQNICPADSIEGPFEPGLPAQFPQVGPDHVPADAAAHLDIATMPDWGM